MGEKYVLIPTSDAEVLAFSKYKKELERYYLLPVPDFEVVQQLVNKRKFYQLCEQLSIPCPKTYFPADLSELKSIGQEIGYPYIIKPSYMHLFTAEFKSKCFVINSSQDLDQAVRRLENKDLDVVIQDIIPGKELYSLSTYFNKEAEPLAVCGYDKLRQYPPDFGIGTLWKSSWREGPGDAITPDY
jgi:predicted ATP-grasp superfamily ATP-dependent carboligase